MGMRLTSLQRVGHTAVENNLINASQRTILLKDEKRLEQRLKEIPAEPGCYLMRDGEDRLLYVGKSKSLRNRVRSYFRSGSDHGLSLIHI